MSFFRSLRRKEMSSSTDVYKHKGRIKQIPIYLGKMFRMFVYMNDWKVIPMAAIISGLVAGVVGKNMFLTMEGTIMASLALSCVCIWNGCFNSIQVVCRERNIIKREHRDGMHISSYIVAHMVYQAFLCLLQSIVTVIVCKFAGMAFPPVGFITASFYVDFGITIFLVTYAADMMALAISCCVRTTTAAMTIMPFILIIELLFSGPMFGLTGTAAKLGDLTVAKWGINAMCSQADYNSLQMVAVWNQMSKFKDVEISGTELKPVGAFIDFLTQEDKARDLCYWMGSMNYNEAYHHSVGNIVQCWTNLIMFAVVFAAMALLVLERIDKDKR